MKKILFKKMVVFVVVLMSTVSTFGYEVSIVADNLEYDEKHKQFSAKGNVILDWEGKKVCADCAEFKTDKKTMSAHGNVKIEEPENIIYADSVTYDYDKKSGEIKESFGYSSKVFIRAKSMEKLDEEIYMINNVKLSKCDLDAPHIYFKANRGKLILNKRVIIYNAILYIGKIPVFYLPLLVRSLKDKKSFFSKFKFRFRPYYKKQDGLLLKMIVSYPLTSSLKVKALFDHLGEGKPVYGGNINYKTQSAIGKIKVFNINDLIKGEKDGVIYSNYHQKVNTLWTLWSNSKFISAKILATNRRATLAKKHNQIVSSFLLNRVKYLSKNFYYDSPFLLEELDKLELIGDALKEEDKSANIYNYDFYLYMTRHGDNTNLMVDVGCDNHKMRDYYLKTDEKFKAEEKLYERLSILAPGISLAYYPKNIFLGIMHKFDFEFASNYKIYDRYSYEPYKWLSDIKIENKYKLLRYESRVKLNYSLTKSFEISKRFVLNPTLGISGTFYPMGKENMDDFISANESGNMMRLGSETITLFPWRKKSPRFFIAECIPSLNSRFRVANWIDWNIDYHLKVANSRNFYPAIEENEIHFSNYMYFRNKITVKSLLMYSFFNDSLEEIYEIGSLKKPLIITELIWTPGHNIVAWIKQEQLLNPFKFNSFLFDFKIGEPEKAYLNFGTSYRYYNELEKNPARHILDNMLGFGLWITPKWKFDYNIKTNFLTGSSIKTFECEFKLSRDLHCYNASIAWKLGRDIKGEYSQEVLFRLDTKKNKSSKKKIKM